MVRFVMFLRRSHDRKGVALRIRDVSFEASLADQAFDTDGLLKDCDARGAIAVIWPKVHRKIQRDYDNKAYK